MKRLKLFLVLMAFMLAPLATMAQNLHVFQDFESCTTGSGNLPTGWTVLEGNPYVNSSSSNAKSGSKYLYFGGYSTYSTPTAPHTVVLPLQSVALNGLKLTLWERVENSSYPEKSGMLHIGYVTDASDPNSFVDVLVVDASTRTTTYAEHVVTFPFAPANARIAIKQETSSNYYWYVDDISIDQMPSCQTPQNLTASNLTGTSAILKWTVAGSTAFGLPPVKFNFLITDAAGNIIKNNIEEVSTLDTIQFEYPLSNLTANTTYRVRIIGDCWDDGQGESDSAVVVFTTLDNARNIPYTEDFNAENATLPTNYYRGATLQSGTKCGNTGKAVKLTPLGSGNDDGAYMVLPMLNVAADNFEMSVMVRGASSSTVSQFMIGFVTDPSSMDYFFPILMDSVAGTDWVEVRFNSADIGDQTTPIMPTILVNVGTVYVDDINIHAIPTCTRPEHLTVTNFDATTATLSWDMCNASNFLIRALNLSDSTVITANAMASPYTITGLSPQTSYELTVQGVCTLTDSSEITRPVQITTRCSVAASTIFYEGAESSSAIPECWETAYMNSVSSSTTAPFQTQTSTKHGTRGFKYNYTTSGSMAYLCSQQLNFDQAGKYSFRYQINRRSGTSYVGEGLKVFVTPTVGDTTNAVEVIPFVSHYAGNSPVGTSGWNEYEGVINYQGLGYIMIVGYTKNSYNAINFDDLEVFLSPTCFKVKDISYSLLTTNSVDMSWTAGASETQWLVQYQLKQGTTVLKDTTELVSSLPFTLTGMSPATTYAISGNIRSYCQEGDTADAVSFSQTFTTLCAPMTAVPYTCGFESSEVVAYNGSSTYKMPLCWSRINDATGYAYDYYPYAASSSYDARTGSGYLKIYYDYDSDDPEHTIAVLNGVDAGAVQISGLRLKFYAKKATTSYNNFPLIVGVMTNPDDTTTFEAVDTLYIDSYSSYEMFSVSFNNYTGNGTYIALYAPGTKSGSPFGKMYGSVYLDDLTLEAIPSCVELTGAVTASDVTENSVKITLDDATAVTGWSYAYAVSGTPVAEMTPVDTTGAFIVLNGLASVTSYDIYVRRHCGNEYSPWAAVTTFTTTSVPATMPYVCGFEDDTENASWQFVDQTTSSTSDYLRIGSVADAVYAGEKALYVTTDATNASNYSYTTTGTTTYAYRTVHFDSKGYQVDYMWKCEGERYSGGPYDFGKLLLVSTSVPIVGGQPTGHSYSSVKLDATEIDMSPEFDFGGTLYKAMHGYASEVANAWNSGSFFLDMTGKAGDYNLVVMWSADGGSTKPLALDNINIYELTCIPPKPENVIVTSLGSDSATLDIIQNDVSEWEIIVATESFNADALPAAPFYRATTTNPTVALNGMTANTDYFYAVRAICGVGDTSKWNAVTKLHTLCAAVNVPYQEGFENVNSGNCWIEQGGNDKKITGRSTSQHYQGTASYVLDSATVVSPEFNVTSLAPYMITFWARATEDSAMIGLGVMTDPSDIDTYTPIGDGALIATKNTWKQVTLYFSDLADPGYSDFANAKYVVLSSGAYRVYIDNIVLDEIPTCPQPTEPRITNISAHSFDISFVNNSQSTEFVVYTNGTPHVITTNPATISGLSASTEYNVEIAAICGNDTSYKASCGTIRTECDAMNLPYSCGFESSEIIAVDGDETHKLPFCWTRLNNDANSTPATFYPYAYSSGARTGSNALYYYIDYDAADADYVIGIMNSIDTTQVELNKVNMKFYAKTSGYSKSFTMYVGMMSDINDTSSFELIQTLTISGDSYVEYNIPFTNYTGNATHPALFAPSTKGTSMYGYIYIDDLELKVLKNCSDPNAPVASNITATTADVAFTDTCAAHHNWEYVYGLAAGFDASALTPVALNDTTGFSISGLTGETDYMVAVRAVCGAGDESNWITTSFRTACVPFVVTEATPFSDSFEDFPTTGTDGTCYTAEGEYSSSYIFKGNTTASYVNTGSKCLQGYYSSPTYQPDGMTIYRQFQLEGGQSYRVSVSSYHVYSSTISELIWGDNTGNINVIVSRSGNTGREELSGLIAPAVTGVYYIGFHVSSNDTYESGYFDDFTVVASNECAPATATIGSITTTSAEVTITDNKPGHSWVYSLENPTGAVVSSGAVTTPAISLSGLAAGTAYTLKLATVCSEGDTSEMMSYRFHTVCGTATLPFVCGFEANEGYASQYDPEATNSLEDNCWNTINISSGDMYAMVAEVTGFSGSQSLVLGSGSYYPVNDMFLVFPQFDVRLDTMLLTFKAATQYEYSAGYLSVGYLTNPNSEATWTELRSISLSDDEIVEYEIDFTQFTGIPANARLAFKYYDHESTYDYSFIDDINLRICPTCREPKTTPTVASATMTTMTVDVDMNNKAKAEIGVAPYSTTVSSADIVTTVETTNGTGVLTNLQGNTQYAVFYRFICADGDTSAWSSMTSYTTKASDCFAPQNVRIVGILNSNSATITWGGAPDAMGYHYELMSGTTMVDSATVTGDTVSFNTLTPSTRYTFKVRTYCAGDTTAYSSLPFVTARTSYDLPFVCDFEDATVASKFTMTNLATGTSTTFVVGSAESNGGSNSMYASNDGGATTSYDAYASTSAEILLNMNPGAYIIKYDWKCEGETTYDYGYAYLVPSSQVISSTSCSTIPTTKVGDIMNGKTRFSDSADEWTTEESIVTITEAGIYNLVFTFRSDVSGQYTAMCVDNVSVVELSCMPGSATIGGLTSSAAKIYAAKGEVSQEVLYGITTTDNPASVATWSSITSENSVDTITFSGLNMQTQYYVFIRMVCDGNDTTDMIRLAFKTPSEAQSLPYVCGFEPNDNVSKWTLTSGQTNNFTFGSDEEACYLGSGALYISNNGADYAYTISDGSYSGPVIGSWSYAYIPLAFGDGQYDISYSWRCAGESSFDYGRIFLLPTSTGIEAGSAIGNLDSSTLPTGAISLESNGKLNDPNNPTLWHDVLLTKTFSDSTIINLVIAWRNDYSTGTQPPLSIDNINISKLTCPAIPAENISTDSVAEDYLRIKVKNPNVGATFKYEVATDSRFVTMVTSGVSTGNDSTFEITNLSASTQYYIAVYSICGDGDTSRRATYSVRTACGVISEFPYVEDFESYEASDKTALENACWTRTGSSTSTSSMYAYASTSYKNTGDKGLYVYNGYSGTPWQQLLMPQMSNFNGKRLSFYHKSYGTTSSYANMVVGYYNMRTETFVPVDTLDKVTDWTAYEYTFNNVPTDSCKIGFKFVGTYYYYVDDIRVNDLFVNTPINETVCYGKPYSGHGISKTFGVDLFVGNNAYTEVVNTSVSGTPDTLNTLNVYMYPELKYELYDTICAGEPYNKNGFTLANPRTTLPYPGATLNPYTSRPLVAACGCDSFITLHLYVEPLTATIDTTICQGDVFVFNGENLTTTCTRTATIPSAKGCNVVTTLNLTVIDSVEVTNATICNGESYTFEGNTYRIAGTYRIPGTGAHGCPMTKVLNLTVVQNDTTVNVTFCRGGFVMVDGIKISTFGQIDTARWDASIGCYRNYHITATEKTIPAQSVTDSVCEGHPYYGNGLNGVIITNDTTFDVTTKTAEMCDSVTHVSIHVIKTVYSSFDADIKEGDSYRWNDEDFTVEGSYERTFQSTVTGCDSVVTLRLHVSPVGVENVTSVKVDVVPNPVTAGMTAYVYGDFGEVENVEILNNFGQVVDRFVPSTYPIEVQGIEASGLYYVRVNTTDGKVYTEKLIVK